jgi:hypothetical protein
MRSKIKLTTRRELSAAIGQRYRTADRIAKKLILDEFTKVTGYHRKHAIRVLTTQRLKPLLPQLLQAMELHGHLQLEAELRTQLLKMSASTIDRLLCSVREHAYGGRKKRTALNRVRKVVPVRTFGDWTEGRPGYLEIDLVTHCGERAVGSFVHTLVLTDVASGWTECVALPVREQTLVVEGVIGIRRKLPFPLLGLDTDNDSAFLNETLLTYCSEQKIVFTRSRAYHKNDQARVEQKNGAIVRKLTGYGRLEGLTATAALRRLYESSRLYTNFFQPSFKLKSKHREGTRVYKSYERPETPCQRLLASNDITPEAKERLQRTLEGLDPVLLLKQIREAQDTLRALSKNTTPELIAPDSPGYEGLCGELGHGLAGRGSTAHPPTGTKAWALVAQSERPLCRSLAGVVELARGEAGHGSQGDAEETAGEWLRRVS